MTEYKWYPASEIFRHWRYSGNAQKPAADSVGAVTLLSENEYLAVVFRGGKGHDVGVLSTLSAAKQTVEALYPMYVEAEK